MRADWSRFNMKDGPDRLTFEKAVVRFEGADRSYVILKREFNGCARGEGMLGDSSGRDFYLLDSEGHIDQKATAILLPGTGSCDLFLYKGKP